MKNLFISNLHEKDVEHFTSNFGLFFRRLIDKPFKKLCNIFTNANIIRENSELSDEEYFSTLNSNYIPTDTYKTKVKKNNIVVERYPKLNEDEPYIFVCNHTCPEDIETVLNIIDRNAYLVLGSIESLKYNPEMYLSFLNGMIPFDILDKDQRKIVFDKMVRVLKTNSILIFPEGSHNYSPNNLINPIFDGPVNLALKTNRKIVVLTLVKDNENNISYIDASNPIDVTKIDITIPEDIDNKEKYYVNSISSIIRDKMATAVYHIMERHFKILVRKEHEDLEEELRMQKIEDAFLKLKWNKDVFEAEYLTKKTSDEKEYVAVVKSLSNLNTDSLNKNKWALIEESLIKKDVPIRMREHLASTNKKKVLKREK